MRAAGSTSSFGICRNEPERVGRHRHAKPAARGGAGPAARRAGAPRAGRAHPLSHPLGRLALAPAPDPHLRRRALRGSRQFLLSRDGPALLEGGPGHPGVHGGLGGPRAGRRRPGRSRAPRPARGRAGESLVPAPGVGAPLRGDGQALRVALQSRRWPREFPARRHRAQLAGRSAARHARAHPGRRVAHAALRHRALLRAPPRHPGRAVRGGPDGWGRRRGDLHAHHLAAPAPHPAHRRPLPDAGRAPVLRPDVRPHGRRPRRHHRDTHGLRLPQSLPGRAARSRLRRRGGRLRARDAGGLGLPARAPPRGARRVMARAGLPRSLRDWAVLLALLASAPLVIWLLTGFLQEIPVGLEEAASVDGASRPRAFRWIVLPLLAPGLASAALLTFLFSWNEFLFAYTFTATEASRTVPVALALFPGVFEVPWGDIAAASMLASVPPVALVVGLQRYLVSGLLTGAVRE